nr:MAG TPA: hypothetical protein [Caudoviricetes sp.]
MPFLSLPFSILLIYYLNNIATNEAIENPNTNQLIPFGLFFLPSSHPFYL